MPKPLSYQKHGAGPVLLFVHPFPMDSRYWQPQIDYFSSQYTVLTPDLRGFGNSPGFAQTKPSIEQMADDIADLLDTLEINEPVIFCGLSIGGYVALRFAQKYFSRLKGLILCDTRAQADTDQTKSGRDGMIDFVQQHTSAQLVKKVLSGLLSKETRQTRPDLVQKVLEIGSSQKSDAIINALKALRDRPDAVEWLRHVTIPTLLIFGEHDSLAPSQVIRTLEEKLPTSATVKVPKAGHFSSLEAPTLFNAAVEKYCKSLQ